MQSEHEKRPARKGRDIRLTIGIIALIVAAIAVLGGGFFHGGMTERVYMGPGFGGVYFLSPWLRMLTSLFWLLVIAGVVLLILSFARRGQITTLGTGANGSRALEILKERYAKGEITREQYEEMRRDIVG